MNSLQEFVTGVRYKSSLQESADARAQTLLLRLNDYGSLATSMSTAAAATRATTAAARAREVVPVTKRGWRAGSCNHNHNHNYHYYNAITTYNDYNTNTPTTTSPTSTTTTANHRLRRAEGGPERPPRLGRPDDSTPRINYYYHSPVAQS